MIELSFSGLRAMISLAAAKMIQNTADSRIAISFLLTNSILQTTLTTANHRVFYKLILLFPPPPTFKYALYRE